jgi:predicted metal-binding protein
VNTVNQIIKKHFPNSKEIPHHTITIDERVRKMCEQNVCGHYNKSWVCPPAVDTLDNTKLKIAAFSTCVIVYKVYDVKSSFDYKGMLSGLVDFRHRLIRLRKDFPESTKYLILGAGHCHLCKECSYLAGEKCKRPADAFVSMEACGIDVIRLMKDNYLKYHNGANTVTYIGAVLYDT